MKHAINELKALLDTWGPQKEASWIRDVEDALEYLQEAQEWLDSDTPVGLSSQVIRKLDARRYEEQHRADMAETNGGSEDDDLGELDASKACKLDNPDCESCS